MEMQKNSLDRLSVEEKMDLLETVWRSIAETPETFPSPSRHGTVLEERTERLRTGRVAVSDWETAKARLLRLCK